MSPAVLDSRLAIKGQHKKDRAAVYSRKASEETREIPPIPAVFDWERRTRCARNFRLFCETYLRHTFKLKWSKDHGRVIRKIQQVVLYGGLFAMAMPRGGGKSSLCEAGALWSQLYGHRGFVVIIGAEKESAVQSLESIKIELETNDLLHEDFPEVTHPIRCLDGIHQRAGGQTYLHKRTYIGWTADEIILPTIPGSRASGAIIRVAGILGRIRGMKHKKPNGTVVRPDVALVDDPQTDESARSPTQCETREAIVDGAVLGLAGPGKTMAAMMPVTVIREGDMADRLLDREKHPEWQAERTRMMHSLPVNERLWERYDEIRRACLREEKGLGEATEFYRANQAEMDEGAESAWPERFEAGEISAIQNAMNIKLARPATFAAEYQNEPMKADAIGMQMLTEDEIASRLSGLRRGLAPQWAVHLTSFADVHDNLIYWAVCAWAADFSGSVIDYGAWPAQSVRVYTLRKARKTLATVYPDMGLEARIRAGLDALASELCGRVWTREDGADLRIERMLVDAGYKSDLVGEFCRRSKHAAVLMPSRGLPLGPTSKPMSEYTRKEGERHGNHWFTTVQRSKLGRHLRFDSNYWKAFAHNRLAIAVGDKSGLTLYGSKAEEHRLIAEHLYAEMSTPVTANGRTVNVFTMRPGREDNHLLDVVAGCAVAAAERGAALPATEEPKPPRRRVSWAAMQRMASQKR